MRTLHILRAALAASLFCGLAACGDDSPVTSPAPDAAPDASPGSLDLDGDGHLAADDCDDHNASVFRNASLFADGDHDGVGDGDATSRCIGAAPPAGFVEVGGDCAPADASAWQRLAYSFRDLDGDQHTVAEAGDLCVGAALPAGYATTALAGDDCDDHDAAVFASVALFPDDDRDGHGAGDAVSLCTDGGAVVGFATTGDDCAADDAARFTVLPYAFRDADLDGATVAEAGTVCAGDALPAGYTDVASGNDCDDANASVRVLGSFFADGDGDGRGAGAAQTLCVGNTVPDGFATVGTDCAPGDATLFQVLAYSFVDADRDGFTLATPGSICSGAQLPPGFTNASNGADCNDADAALHATQSGFADADLDGVGAGAAVTLCTNGTLPPGFVTSSNDCAPDNAQAWRVLNGFKDADGDTFTVAAATPLCTGNTLPAPFLAARNGSDCDDADAAVFRFAVLYPDHDADGVGAPPRQISCIGRDILAGTSIYGDDPDDNDPNRSVDEDADDDLFTILD